jgi:hypothetical protein
MSTCLVEFSGWIQPLHKKISGYFKLKIQAFIAMCAHRMPQLLNFTH